MKYPLSFALLAGLGLGMAGLSYAPPAAAQVSVHIGAHFGAPVTRVARAPLHRPGYVWAPGHWRWRAHHRVWAGGHWVRVRHHRHGRAHHRRAHWVRDHRGGWHRRHGYGRW